MNPSANPSPRQVVEMELELKAGTCPVLAHISYHEAVKAEIGQRREDCTPGSAAYAKLHKLSGAGVAARTLLIDPANDREAWALAESELANPGLLEKVESAFRSGWEPREDDMEPSAVGAVAPSAAHTPAVR